MVSRRWPALSTHPAARLQASRQAGSPPRELESATPIRKRLRESRAGVGWVADMIENESRASATLRAIAPREERPAASISSHGTRSGDGRRPTTPQHEDGMRIEPPMSVPIAIVAMPAATAAALPPLDPPGVTPSRHGFWVAGKRVLTVPTEAASSGRLVLPRMAVPAALAHAIGTASSVAMRSRYMGVPSVQGIPATGMLSLTAIVTPAHSPGDEWAARSTWM